MNNRISKRRPGPEDTASASPIASKNSPGTPSKNCHPRKEKDCRTSTWSLQLQLQLLIAITALLLFGYFIGSMVDLRFLGGVFVIGLDDQQQQQQQQQQSLPTDTERNNFPDGWQTYSYNDIRHHFRCSQRSKDNAKPLPSLEDWQLMRDKFTEIVDPTKRWDDDPVPPTLGYSLETGTPVPPPYYPKFSPGKGRGLFASRDIQKGELVHDGTVSDVVFPNAVAWRKFVFSLPREYACDSTDWHWMQKLEGEGDKYFMLAGINISSLMNSGGKEFGPGRQPNALPESSTSGKFHALRDIDRGEEILTDYDAYYTNWREVGL